MFGHDSLPTRLYTFGAKPPADNLPLVEEQMSLAHKYRNQLVELERERRRLTEEAMHAAFPQLAQLQQQWEAADLAVKDALAEAAKANADARKRVAKGERSKISALKAATKEAYQSLKAAKREAYQSDSAKQTLDAINDRIGDEQKRLRAASGLYWGTYLIVEQSLKDARKGPPPQFKRWDGSGHLAVQLQHGLTWDQVCGEDSRVRVKTDGDHRKRRHLYLRVSSDGRKPVFAKVCFYQHREIPGGAQIKWVHLLRRRIGTRQEWSVQFAVSRPGGFDPIVAASGAVGVDVGWRLVAGGLRVASWVGGDGATGQLVLDDDHLTSRGKVESIQAIRDQHFNAVREVLAEWLLLREANDKIEPLSIPSWLAEKTKTMKLWNSPNRLAAVYWYWRANRFKFDEKMFANLEGWLKKDRHLYDWQESQRTKTARRRMDRYRNFAAELAQKYRLVCVEDTDWRKLQRRPGPDEEINQAARLHQRTAAVSLLLQCLRERFAEVLKVDAKYTTQRCHACGRMDAFDSASELVRTCRHCQTTADQDERAARNLLAASASGEV